MRPPFRDVFPVEPLSKWKMLAVAALGLAIGTAVAVKLVSGGMMAYAEPAIRQLAGTMAVSRSLPIALQKFWIVVGLMAFANVFVAYWVLRCTDSAEFRVLLRWSLHLAVWSELFYLTFLTWSMLWHI